MDSRAPIVLLRTSYQMMTDSVNCDRGRRWNAARRGSRSVRGLRCGTAVLPSDELTHYPVELRVTGIRETVQIRGTDGRSGPRK